MDKPRHKTARVKGVGFRGLVPEYDVTVWSDDRGPDHFGFLAHGYVEDALLTACHDHGYVMIGNMERDEVGPYVEVVEAAALTYTKRGA